MVKLNNKTTSDLNPHARTRLAKEQAKAVKEIEKIYADFQKEIRLINTERDRQIAEILKRIEQRKITALLQDIQTKPSHS